MEVNLKAIDDSEIRRAVAEWAQDVDDETGRIVGQPGKFESEPIWSVYFYYLTLQGEGEDHYADCEHTGGEWDGDCACDLEIEYTRFDVQAGDAEVFPWLDPHIGKELRVREDSQGFVYSWIVEAES